MESEPNAMITAREGQGERQDVHINICLEFSVIVCIYFPPLAQIIECILNFNSHQIA